MPEPFFIFVHFSNFGGRIRVDLIPFSHSSVYFKHELSLGQAREQKTYRQWDPKPMSFPGECFFLAIFFGLGNTTFLI